MKSHTPRALALLSLRQESYRLASAFLASHPERPVHMPHTMRRCAVSVIGYGASPLLRPLSSRPQLGVAL